jgi:hypothetical protein
MRRAAAVVAAVIACFVVAVIACSVPEGHFRAPTTGDGGPADAAVDMSPDSFSGVCDPFAQTGCPSNQKCAWIALSTSSGMVGCAPNGTVAAGGACTPGPMGMADNCVAGNQCANNKCEKICDTNHACAANFFCDEYQGIFVGSGSNTTPFAGMCDAECDPFADNDFGGGTKPGTTCSGSQGCYGIPDYTTPTHYICGNQITSIGNRQACTGVCGPYLNGCGQGYVPVFSDGTGSSQVDCISFCRPADCSSAGCGASGANLPGDPTAGPDGRRHQCNMTDSKLGTFNPATTTNNGDQCVYEWYLDVNPMNGMVTHTPTMNTVGYCLDHTLFAVPSNPAMATNCPSTTSPGCEPMPACNTLPIAGGMTAYGAVDFGCVSTTTGGVPLTGKPRRPPGFDVRLMYHRVMAP